MRAMVKKWVRIGMLYPFLLEMLKILNGYSFRGFLLRYT
jgi:hypothetical protein